MKHAFLGPNGVLKTWGFVESNEEGDVRLEVSEDFNLAPGKWRWEGTQWVPYPNTPEEAAVIDAAQREVAAAVIDYDKNLLAFAEMCLDEFNRIRGWAGKLLLTRQQVIEAFKTKRRALE